MHTPDSTLTLILLSSVWDVAKPDFRPPASAPWTMSLPPLLLVVVVVAARLLAPALLRLETSDSPSSQFLHFLCLLPHLCLNPPSTFLLLHSLHFAVHTGPLFFLLRLPFLLPIATHSFPLSPFSASRSFAAVHSLTPDLVATTIASCLVDPSYPCRRECFSVFLFPRSPGISLQIWCPFWLNISPVSVHRVPLCCAMIIGVSR
jgi:hypothetical protein